MLNSQIQDLRPNLVKQFPLQKNALLKRIKETMTAYSERLWKIEIRQRKKLTSFKVLTTNFVAGGNSLPI